MERVDRETIRALPFFGEDTRRASCSRPPRWSAARGRSPSRGRGRTTGAGDLSDSKTGEAGEHAGGVDLEAADADDDAGDLLHRPSRTHLRAQRRRVLHPPVGVGGEQSLVGRPGAGGLDHRVALGDGRLDKPGLAVPAHPRRVADGELRLPQPAGQHLPEDRVDMQASDPSRPPSGGTLCAKAGRLKQVRSSIGRY